MQIDVWSDIVCPWCAIGKQRLDAALRTFAHADQVEVVWHAFELDPTPSEKRPKYNSITELLAKKYGMSLAQAQAANERVVATAEQEGLQWQMDKVIPTATFDAHRLLQLAATVELQPQVMARLMQGYFAEGKNLSDRTTLAALAVEGGLDATQVEAVLASDQFAAAVRDDERLATEAGITGVPFFVIDRKYALSGAQPAATMARALDEAWQRSQV